MKLRHIILLVLTLVVGVTACRKENDGISPTWTPYELDVPSNFPPMSIPQDNPMSVEGIELGRRLFYDERLSDGDFMSCASCHEPSLGFGDDTPFSAGFAGALGTRNSMPLFNLGWQPYFFWDGRAATLEDQILEPVVNPIEMHENWPNVIDKLRLDPLYPDMFYQAFGVSVFDSTHAAKAIAQFLRTIISADSKFDRWRRGEPGVILTPSEQVGFSLFLTEDGDCFHCHAEPFFADFSFKNNGLENPPFADSGAYNVTGNPADIAAFKVPSLRNLVFTAPYMHDGRFSTIDDVINFYSTGVNDNAHTHPFMQFAGNGGVDLTPQEKADLKAFLLALTDSSLINNPDFQDPGY